MEKWYKVAGYLAERLTELKGVDEIDLLTLNKVLYFAQRESYVRDREPLFDTDKFKAAPLGPVIIALKRRLREKNLTTRPESSWIDEHKALLDYVVKHYGAMSAYTLSNLSHLEISWRNAVDRATDVKRYEPISDSDIQIDALKIRMRDESISESKY